jgi:predicted GNAT superfamily acetyltransferase
MDAWPDHRLRPIAPESRGAVLRLNAAHETETSTLDATALGALIDTAFAAWCAGFGTSGFLIALDQDAPYGSENFRWFRDRFARFVYVDRIVVAPGARRTGLARALYRRLFARMREAGQSRVCCEVNITPPNPVSEAFHAALGFKEAGRATLPANGKTVRYLTHGLDP